MQKFITALMKWGVKFALLLAVLLLLIGAVLIWCPEILAKLVRGRSILLCLAGGAWILISLLIGMWKKK